MAPTYSLGPSRAWETGCPCVRPAPRRSIRSTARNMSDPCVLGREVAPIDGGKTPPNDPGRWIAANRLRRRVRAAPLPAGERRRSTFQERRHALAVVVALEAPGQRRGVGRHVGGKVSTEAFVDKLLDEPQRHR